jgi:hypothetical protein
VRSTVAPATLLGALRFDPMSTRHDGSDVQKSAVEARQGITLGVVRWVLLISLVLAVVAFVAVFAFA